MKTQRRNSIKVYLEGGTGNQLFMYFAGLAVALQNDADLKLETKYVGKFGTNHGCFLNELNINASLITSTELSSFSIFITRVLNALVRRVKVMRMIQMNLFGVYRSAKIGYDEEVFELSGNLKISGYFQSWKYFDYCSERNMSNLSLLKPSQNYLSALYELQKSPTIAVHVRRGDYGPLLDTFGLLDERYFVEAVEQLTQLIGSNRIWVFSDDIESTKRTFKNTIWREATFINYTLSPVETIYLMSQASGNVISNSSFSYWSAMLANNQSSVIAPDPWFKNIPTPNELLPQTWLTNRSSWMT